MSIATIITLIIAGIAGLSIVWWTLRTGISPMPSSKKAVDAMITLIPPDFEGVAVELGSGWGTVGVAMADRFPKAKFIGYELSPLPWLSSWIRTKVTSRHNLSFKRVNFTSTDLSGAQLVICYLYPGGMARLAGQLERELQSQTTVVSNTFRIPGWTPIRTIELKDLYRTPIYQYRVGEHLRPPTRID